jgi:hypothetical protein
LKTRRWRGCACGARPSGRHLDHRPRISPRRRDPAGRQAEGPAQAGDQGLDRQGGVGEVDVDAFVLGQLFPELDGQLFLCLGVGSRGDGVGDALGDGLAPVILLLLPGLPPDFGLAPCLLPLLAQPGLERYGAADAEEQAAEAGLRIPGAVEIADREGGEGQGVKAAGQLLREFHQLGQHRGLVRGRRRGGVLPPPAQLERDGTADGEEEGAEAAFGLAGTVEIAGSKGGESLGLEGPGQLQGELGQPGQHLGLPAGLLRGRRSGGLCLGCAGIDHVCIRTKREQSVKRNRTRLGQSGGDYLPILLSCPGLTRASRGCRSRSGWPWIAGSSPAMTIEV